MVVQNSDPYTYFGRRPIRIGEGTGAPDRDARRSPSSRRATPLELPTVLWRAFSGKAATVARHRQIEAFPGVSRARVRAIDDRPFPVQVDGDFIGEFDEVEYGIEPLSLRVVA